MGTKAPRALPVNDIEAGYARRGDVDNVIFPCGYTLAADGDTVHLYCGAADTGMALATSSVKELLEWLNRNGRENGFDWRPASISQVRSSRLRNAFENQTLRD